MLRLENFGITPSYVTTMIVAYAIGFLTTCALGILLWCLFGIGLSRIAKKRGEEKEWYGYLPLLRLYTLGRMTKGSEKTRKVFACLLPSLAIAKFVMTVISAALLARSVAGIIFAAENMADSAISLSALVQFPLTYCLWALVITAVIALAYKIVYVISYYGAVSGVEGGKAIVFTVLGFLCRPLGPVFLFVASRDKEEKTADQKAE